MFRPFVKEDDSGFRYFILSQARRIQPISSHNIFDDPLQYYPSVYSACCFVWVWNLVADIAGGKEAEGVWEHGVEENIWT